MDDSSSLSSLNSADFILIGKEQPRLKVASGMFFIKFFFVPIITFNSSIVRVPFCFYICQKE